MSRSAKDGKGGGGHKRKDCREYWSSRHPGMLDWGREGKQLTHRRERAIQDREDYRLFRLGPWLLTADELIQHPNES